MIRNHKILLSRQLKNGKNIDQIIKTTTEKENKTEKIFITKIEKKLLQKILEKEKEMRNQKIIMILKLKKREEL